MKNSKLIILLALTFFCFRSSKSGYDIGEIVKDFTLKSTSGDMVSLKDYSSAKGIIIVFDCNTCPYSQAYNERIIALAKKYDAANFPLIAINANDPQKSPGDSFNSMIEQAKNHKYSFPYLIDETQEVAKAFGATNTPHVFVLNHIDNTFKVAYIGAIDNNTQDADKATKKYVEEAVDEILSNKPVTTPKTKAIGCGIKWKPA